MAAFGCTSRVVQRASCSRVRDTSRRVVHVASAAFPPPTQCELPIVSQPRQSRQPEGLPNQVRLIVRTTPVSIERVCSQMNPFAAAPISAKPKRWVHPITILNHPMVGFLEGLEFAFPRCLAGASLSAIFAVKTHLPPPHNDTLLTRSNAVPQAAGFCEVKAGSVPNIECHVPFVTGAPALAPVSSTSTVMFERLLPGVGLLLRHPIRGRASRPFARHARRFLRASAATGVRRGDDPAGDDSLFLTPRGFAYRIAS